MQLQDLIITYTESEAIGGNVRSKKNISTVLTKFFCCAPTYDVNCLSKQDFSKMLAESSIMSMNTFDSYKSKISGFLKWMCSNGLCSESVLKDWQSIRFADIDRSNFYDTYYFKSYSELFETVQNVLGEGITEQDTFKAATTLVWFGIEVKYLPQILKDDLHETESYIIHPMSKRKIYMPEPAVRQLADYKHADVVPSNKLGGRLLSYPEGQYLFRTYKNAHLSDAQITNLSAAANKTAQGKKIFQWNRIYLSGLYQRMLDYENQFGEIGKTNHEKLRLFFGKDGQTPRKGELSQKYKEYQEFKIYMYSSRR